MLFSAVPPVVAIAWANYCLFRQADNVEDHPLREYRIKRSSCSSLDLRRRQLMRSMCWDIPQSTGRCHVRQFFGIFGDLVFVPKEILGRSTGPNLPRQIRPLPVQECGNLNDQWFVIQMLIIQGSTKRPFWAHQGRRRRLLPSRP